MQVFNDAKSLIFVIQILLYAHIEWRIMQAFGQKLRIRNVLFKVLELILEFLFEVIMQNLIDNMILSDEYNVEVSKQRPIVVKW